MGSKARGDARADSDLDVLVVIREGDWHFKEALTRLGYDLAIGTEVVPSLHVYTVAEWEHLRKHASAFREVVGAGAGDGSMRQHQVQAEWRRARE